jgi:hypothetical protein
MSARHRREQLRPAWLRPARCGPANCCIGAFEGKSRAPCAGDCDGSGDVQINEIIQCVSIALGNAPLPACTACDANGNGQVAINEIIGAVGNALNGCGGG